MLGAFRRSVVSHALRSTPRTLSSRSTPQRLQSLYSSVSGPSIASRSLFHTSPLRFSQDAAQQLQSEQSEQADDLPLRFDELGSRKMVSRDLVHNLTKNMRLETMTDVQRKTITESLKGADMFAQAKTGTGKTVAFLIPVVERLLQDKSVQEPIIRRGRKIGNIDIRAIIISPTRELAEQIATEARRLVARTKLTVQTAVGGTQKNLNMRQMREEGCHILVGTPGRLRDVLEDPGSGVDAPKLSSFVLDEADRLLDDGFAPELMEIQKLLPDPSIVDRQTLMFSATVAPEVMGMVRKTMKPDFQFVKTVRDDEVPTHLSVPQKAVVLRGLENALPALLDLAKRTLADRERPFKAICYFNSTKVTNSSFEVFDQLRSDPDDHRSPHPLGRIYLAEIHSGLSQFQRTRVATQFRKCQSGILFSSDVTARGMDFPGVTHVIQCGTPKTRDEYIHRLGRTARAGKTGEGWSLLHEQEVKPFQRMLRDIPFDLDRTSLPSASADMAVDAENPPEVAQTLLQIKSGMAQIPEDIRRETVHSSYGSFADSFQDKGEIQDAVTALAVNGYGLAYPPRMPRFVADKVAGYETRRSRDSRGYGSNARRGFRGSNHGPSSYGHSFGGRSRDSGRSFNRDSGRNSRDSGRDFGRNSRDFGRDFGRPSRRGGAFHPAENLDKWLNNRRDEWA